MRPAARVEPPLLRCDALSHRYATGLQALENVSLEVAEGDFISLIGPSGCGKSTLLRLIAGLETPSAGTLDWPAGRPAPGDIGLVFQEPTLMPWAKVIDNICLPLRLTKRSVPDSDISAVIDLVGLADFADAFPNELSGGMKMRVSLARALVTKPRLLLLDEPFAALDEITRFRLNDDLLRIWWAQGCTVIFVTHSVYEAAFLSQRVLVMSSRPSRIFAEEPIDLPLGPARDASVRADPAYVESCLRLSQHLAGAMADIPA